MTSICAGRQEAWGRTRRTGARLKKWLPLPIHTMDVFLRSHVQQRIIALTFLGLCTIRTGQAQEFKLWNRTVQVHGFFSQGYVKTDANNWLSMDSSQGGGAMTDMGLNISSQVTDRFRVGAQVYDRNVGQLGQWHPSLDWAVADYRLTNWFGVRAGKVKTTLGLYNDSQDLDFLHVFALLPQSVYPTDLRETTIAHIGGDLYGNLPLRGRLGDVSYTAYAGHRSDSVYSGYPYLLLQWGTHLRSLGGLQYGADLRWNAPLRGLVVGISRMNEDITGRGTFVAFWDPAAGVVPYFESSSADWTNQYYAQFNVKRFCMDYEYRRYLRNQVILNGTSRNITDVRGWYVAGTYRLTKKLKIGSYYSHYAVSDAYGGLVLALGQNDMDTSLERNHTYDKVVTARLDFNRFWHVKLEGHFMDGYANGGYPAGFYPRNNPQGFAPQTNALVVKTGFNF